MKIFLFLYPVMPYIDHLLHDYRGLEAPMQRLNELIDIRYRQQGYGVCWLLFSQEQDPNSPDFDLVSPKFLIYPEDDIISAGITFRELTEEKKYPDMRFVRSQLADEISEVKLGGYHQFDCVSKAGEYFHHSGIPTLVDEDTTQFFFSALTIHGFVPDSREFTMEGFNYLMVPDDPLFEEVVRARKNEPWFVQPRIV